MEDINKEAEKLMFANYVEDDLARRIVEINSFINRFSGDPLFPEHEAGTIYMKADALFELGRYHEALEVYRKVLELNPPSIDIVSAQKAATILLTLEMEPEATSVIEQTIGKQTMSGLKLELMDWYVNHMEDSETWMAQYAEEIQIIRHEYGINVPEHLKSFKEVISHLQGEMRRSSRSYIEMTLDFDRMEESEKRDALKRFISSEKVGYYKQKAKDYLKSLDS